MNQATVALADLYKWTVTEFHQMVAAGIIEEDAQVELLHGQIMQMSPVGKFHAACVSFLNDWLTKELRFSSIIRVQDPIRLDNNSEPEPDIVVVKRRPDFYAHQLPGPDDIELVIEVADSSIQRDREIKLPLYAEFSIKEYWLVDLSNQEVSIYYDPEKGKYKRKNVFQVDDHFQHPTLGSINVSNLFPWL